MRTARLALAALLLGGCSIIGSSGPAIISFGTKLDTTALTLLDSRSSFSAGDTFAYAVTLNEPAGATMLTETISRQQGSAQVVVYTETADVADPTYDQFANSVSFDLLIPYLGQTGTFVMRFLRDTTVLAQGTFTYQ